MARCSWYNLCFSAQLLFTSTLARLVVRPTNITKSFLHPSSFHAQPHHHIAVLIRPPGTFQHHLPHILQADLSHVHRLLLLKQQGMPLWSWNAQVASFAHDSSCKSSHLVPPLFCTCSSILRPHHKRCPWYHAPPGKETIHRLYLACCCTARCCLNCQINSAGTGPILNYFLALVLVFRKTRDFSWRRRISRRTSSSWPSSSFVLGTCLRGALLDSCRNP